MRVRWIVVAVVAVAGIVVGLDRVAPLVAARLAEDAAADAGFPEARVSAVRLGLDGTTIGEITLDAAGHNRLGPIRIDYDLADLRRQRVRAITVDAATLEVTVTADGGFQIAGLTLPAGGDAAAPPPFDRLDVTAAAVALATPEGDVDLAIADGHVTVTGGAITAGARVSGRHAVGDGRADVVVRVADGGIEAEATGIAASIGHPLLTVTGVTGRATGRWTADGTLAFTADLAAPAVVIGDAALADATLALSSDGRTIAATVRATGPGGADLAAEGTLPLAGDGPLAARLTLAVPDLAALGSAARGTLNVTADLTGNPPVADAPWRASGTFRATLGDGGLAGFAADVAVDAAGTLVAAPDRVEVVATAPWTVAGTLVAERVPPELAGALGGALAAVLAPSALVARRNALGWTVDVGGGFAITRDGVGFADGTVGALSVALDGEGRPGDFRIAGLTAAVRDIAIAGTGIPDATVTLDAAGSTLAWSGAIDAAATLRPALPDDVAADALRVAGVADLAFADGVLVVRGRDCLSAAASRVVAFGFALDGPVDLCLQDATAEVGPGGASLTGTLEPMDLAGTLGGGEPVPITAHLGALTLDVTAEGAKATLAATTVTLPELAIALDGLAGTADLSTGGAGNLAIAGRVVHGGQPAWFAPLNLAIKAGLKPGAPIALTATIDDPTGALAIDVTATHDVALGAGHAEIKLFPVTFVPGRRPPDRLFPILHGLVEEAAGGFAAEAETAWSGAGLIGGATVKLDNLSALIGPARVEALNGVVRLDRLWPPSLPPGQQVAIGLIDVGVPLTNGVVTFWMAPNGRVSVDRARWDWAGGVVGARPFSARLDDPEWRIALTAEDLDLARILEIVDIGGLTGTGTLAGELPLRLTLDTIAVEHGLLAATRPGVLRYVPSATTDVLGTGQGGTEVLLDALSNFQYEKLALSIDGVAGGETALGLRVEGRNPDLYDGYPVALNVNLSGALDTILRRGLAGYRIPDQVREQLESYGKEQP